MSLSDKIYIPSHTSEEDLGLNGLVSVTNVRESVRKIKDYFKDITKDLGYSEEDMCLTLKDIIAGIDEEMGEKLC